MSGRPNPYVASPELIKPLLEFSDHAGAEVIEPSLRELVCIRVSQMNGCGICLQVHSERALRLGETRERITLLDAWRESSIYSARERAALAWAEALNRIDPAVSNEPAYPALAAQFEARDQVALTLVIAAINAMNRAGVGFGVGPVPQKALEKMLDRVPA
jgi:AhpD family alkylhydroperoxidase